MDTSLDVNSGGSDPLPYILRPPLVVRFGRAFRTTPPVQIVIDSSSDNIRAAYVALVLNKPEKPRLIYGVGVGVSTGDVETWGINRAIRRVNERYGSDHPILVFTDNLWIAIDNGNERIQYRWLSRDKTLIQHLHQAATSLRRSMAKPPYKKLTRNASIPTITD